MLGKNPIRPAENSDGKKLAIKEIYPTIQTEGPFSGYAAVFIRLGGCNLACKFCDTEFENYKDMALDKIIKETIKLSKNPKGETIRKLVVITGGEPLRQNISPLCDELIKNDFEVQLETNGTLYRKLNKKVFIVCSPKAVGGKYSRIRPDLLARVNAFKFLVSAFNAGYSEIRDVGQKNTNIPVYIQPMDLLDKIKNQANINLATELARKNGYQLSQQYHKLLGLR